MKNLWQKIKEFFSRIWHGLTVAGRIIFGIIIVGIIALGVYAASDKDSDNNNENSNPEVAQTFEPSIGSPLPADRPGETGTVDGASTTEPSGESNSTQITAKVSDEVNDKVAPNAGVNPNAPVPYQNDSLKFAATLPAGSKVNEQDSAIQFSSQTGQFLYLVSTHDNSNETLAGIEAQLRNSPSTTNIVSTKFANTTALEFNAGDYKNGLVFIANGKIYYLLGDSQYFPTFKII